MRTFGQSVVALCLVSFGYVLGTSNVFTPISLRAQNGAAQPSEDTREKIADAHSAVESAQQAMEQDEVYVPAITGINSFAVTVGGVNAVRDLQNGQAVDPETFVGLYAGLATPEIAKDIDRDEQNRMTYNGKIIKLYPVSRLKRLLAIRESPVKKADDDATN